MAYSTPAMVRRILNPLGSDDGSRPTPSKPSNTAADLDDAALSDAIAEADTIIDSRLGGVYTTPVANTAAGVVPHPLDFWSRDIAAWLATLTYRKGQELPQGNPVALRYSAVMDALKSASVGHLHLGFAEQVNDVREGAGAPVNPYDGTLFGPEDFGINSVNPEYLHVPYWRGRGW